MTRVRLEVIVDLREWERYSLEKLLVISTLRKKTSSHCGDFTFSITSVKVSGLPFILDNKFSFGESSRIRHLDLSG